MSIIKHYNAANDTTYVYESVSYWDKELKQPRSKRKLIGKLDPVTGEVVPTGGRGGRKRKDTDSLPASPEASTPTGNNSDSLAGGTCQAETEDVNLRTKYEECYRKLLQTEASLAKAESSIAQLTKETKELHAELEQLMQHLEK